MLYKKVRNTIQFNCKNTTKWRILLSERGENLLFKKWRSCFKYFADIIDLWWQQSASLSVCPGKECVTLQNDYWCNGDQVPHHQQETRESMPSQANWWGSSKYHMEVYLCSVSQINVLTQGSKPEMVSRLHLTSYLIHLMMEVNINIFDHQW